MLKKNKAELERRSMLQWLKEWLGQTSWVAILTVTLGCLSLFWDGNSSSTYLSVFQEKALATHSSTLAWKIPWTEEPDGLQSMGSWRAGHDWATSLLLFTFMHWRRKWRPTPVFLPGESQGPGSLVGYRLWGRTESDMTEATLAAAAEFFMRIKSVNTYKELRVVPLTQ